MKIIAIANQKGGVGKTTVVVNLAASLAAKGFRVAVLDMDSQANATTALGVNVPEGTPGLAHVLVGAAKLGEIILPSQTEGVVVAPATEDLAKADMKLVSMIGRENILRRAMKEIDGRFDFVLIDTSPYLGLLTVNALLAAEHVLVPVSAEFLPMVGLRALNETIDELRRNTDAPLDVLGYLVTMFDKRLGIAGDAVEMLSQRFGERVLKSKIRVNVNLKAAPSHGRDILQLEKRMKKPWKGIEDFEALTDEVLALLKLTPNTAAAA